VADAIDEAISAAKQRYVAENPLSLARSEFAARSMPGGNTRTTLHYDPFPLGFGSADGSRLHSLDGRTYVDLLGEYTAGLYGHSHPLIMAAVHSALDTGISFGGHGVHEAELAALVTGRFPSVDLVRFTNSGTEANLMALATATAVTGRSKVVVFRGGYHGSVLTFATGGLPINVPHDFVVASYNDVEGTRSLLRELGETVAAVLLEPMMGTGGCITATHEFLRMLRDETASAGAILIFDEVMTSRLAPGGMQEVHDIHADLTTFGKYIGGGMSFGAFGGRRDLMARYDPTVAGSWPHAGTFNNNVLTMAAGVVGLRDIYTAEACLTLNRRGDALRERLNSVFETADVGMQVTGVGSLMTIHATSGRINTPADLAGSDERVKELFFFEMLAEGFWLARRAMIALSLFITDDDCDELVAAVTRFVSTHRPLLATRSVERALHS
jgi:glutamate-1-semialdehyde 2,1-aminomutase